MLGDVTFTMQCDSVVNVVDRDQNCRSVLIAAGRKGVFYALAPSRPPRDSVELLPELPRRSRRHSAAKLLTRDEAHQVAVNFAYCVLQG